MAFSRCFDGSEPMTTDSSPDTMQLVVLARRIAHGLWALLGRSAPHLGASGPDGGSDDPNDAHSVIADALRTPLTSIRSFSEILHDNPNLSPEERAAFLEIVIDESQRLERAIAAVLHEDATEADDKAA